MKNLVPNRPPKKWLIVRALLLKIHEQVLNGTKPENSAPKTATATVRQWPLLWPVHARGSSSPAIEPTKVAQQRCPQSRWPPPQRIHTTSDRFELPKKKEFEGDFLFWLDKEKINDSQMLKAFKNGLWSFHDVKALNALILRCPQVFHFGWFGKQSLVPPVHLPTKVKSVNLPLNQDLGNYNLPHAIVSKWI